MHKKIWKHQNRCDEWTWLLSSCCHLLDSSALSWDLLSWMSMKDRIFPSFTAFTTTPGILGPLYISPDVYHTQITEYSLETKFRHHNNFRWALFSANRLVVLIAIVLDLLPLALAIVFFRGLVLCGPPFLPTEMILSTPVNSFTGAFTWWQLKIDPRLTITKWLEVSVSIYDHEPQLKPDLCLGTWFWATEWLVRSLDLRTLSKWTSPLTFGFDVWSIRAM